MRREKRKPHLTFIGKITGVPNLDIRLYVDEKGNYRAWIFTLKEIEEFEVYHFEEIRRKKWSSLVKELQKILVSYVCLTSEKSEWISKVIYEPLHEYILKYE
jgi:hypothetical protein